MRGRAFPAVSTASRGSSHYPAALVLLDEVRPVGEAFFFSGFSAGGFVGALGLSSNVCFSAPVTLGAGVGLGSDAFPTCAVVGLVPDVNHTSTTWWKERGHEIALLGVCTGEAGGSEYLAACFDKVAGLPPRLDVARELAVQAAVRELVRAGLVASAHDCADGGIAVALAESCIMGAPEGGLGAKVRIPGDARIDLLLFAEDPSRVLISYDPARRAEVEAVARKAGAPFAVIGQVGGDSLEIEGALQVPVQELAHRWGKGFTQVLGLADAHYPDEIASRAAPI